MSMPKLGGKPPGPPNQGIQSYVLNAGVQAPQAPLSSVTKFEKIGEL